MRFLPHAALLALSCAAVSASAAPKLLVWVTIEQLRSDALERYAADFSDRGFHLLREGGAVLPNGRYAFGVTLAAPAAATLATGAQPATHGIIADHWFSGGQTVAATGAEDSAGPTHLIGSTLADELVLASEGRSRVVVVSGSKPPAAFLGGRRPRGAYWQSEAGVFETSRYYGGATPVWLTRFNGAMLRAPARRVWKALNAPEDAPPLRKLEGPGAAALYRASPQAADDLFRLASETITEEGLGGSGAPDLLIINVSAPALLALETGAVSPLLRDMMARLDRSLAGFLERVDESIGLENVVVAVTGLHGGPPQRDALKTAGVPHGLVSGEEVAQAIQSALGEELGSGARLERYVYPFVYLDRSSRAATAERRQRILTTVGEAAMALPGVVGYYSPEVSSVSAEVANRLGRSWHSGRSGDLMLLYAPYFTERYGDGRGTAPGSPYRYDTDVPAILFGRQFRPGVYQQRFDPASLAPTLAAILGIAAPSSSEAPLLDQILLQQEGPVIGPPPVD